MPQITRGKSSAPYFQLRHATLDCKALWLQYLTFPVLLSSEGLSKQSQTSKSDHLEYHFTLGYIHQLK